MDLITKIEAACDEFRLAPELEVLDAKVKHDLLDCPLPSMLLPVSIAYFTMMAKANLVDEVGGCDSQTWLDPALEQITNYYGPATDLLLDLLKEYMESGAGSNELVEFQKGLREVCASKDDYIIMSQAFRAAFWVYVELYREAPFDFERQVLLTRAYFRAMKNLNENAATHFGGAYQNEFNF